MPVRLMTLFALALAAGLIAAGCGDDDDETTTAATTTSAGATGATGAATGEPLTKDEFISQADQICTTNDKEINQAFGALGGGKPSDQELEQVVTETLVPTAQDTIDGIAALTPPEGDEDEVNAILDAAQKAVDEIEQDPSSLSDPQAEDPFAEVDRLSKDYGLKKC